MNRGQAENVLDAYVESASSKSVGGRKAAEALRSVILDAMTETSYYPIFTRPTMPTVEPCMPTVTWRGDVEAGRTEVGA